MKLSECINFALTNAQNSVFLYFKNELSVLDVTPIQYALLKCLWEQDNQMPTQLAQQLRLDASSITGILSRLEEKKLIVRGFCTTDRRRVSVFLTDAGRELQKPVEDLIAKANAVVTEGLSQKEIEQLYTYLNVIVGNVAKQTDKK